MGVERERAVVVAVLVLGSACTSCSSFSEEPAPTVDGGADAGPGPGIRMFVSSRSVKGDFGGVAEADTLCRSTAAAKAFGGSWIALLLAGDVPSAFTKLKGGRYVNTKGETLFVEKPAALSTLAGKMLDENGSAPPALVWTGAEGTVGNCGNWRVGAGISGNVGDSTNDRGWFGGDTLGCGKSAAVYCVEVP